MVERDSRRNNVMTLIPTVLLTVFWDGYVISGGNQYGVRETIKLIHLLALHGSSMGDYEESGYP